MDQPGEFDFYKDYMNDDEYILWSGKPDRGNLLEAKDGVFISLGTGFVLLTLFFLDLSMKYVHSVFLIVFLILCLAFEGCFLDVYGFPGGGGGKNAAYAVKKSRSTENRSTVTAV